MMSFEDIRDVHLEISTLCNASCPWCPRNFWGYPYNGGYPELNLDLASAQKLFSQQFLTQLDSIRINGNYGDIVMNPDGADIIEYFKKSNPDLDITIHTNGSARTKRFWQRLALAQATVLFALDGLEDTHYLYRQNTIWKQILKNAETFINMGGKAIWKMIEFDHNRHQVDECRTLSQQLGFFSFELIKHTRGESPVFDKTGRFLHTIGNYQDEKDFNVLIQKKKTDEVLLEDITPGRTPCKSVACNAKKMRSIYIAANGDVSPCCWTGVYPKTYGKGQYYQAANAQLIPMIQKNNALKYPLKECIEWFKNVEKSWSIESYEHGRLVICDDNCGR